MLKSDQTEIPPELWMEARIRHHQITRLWIHFTTEALPQLGIEPEAYLVAAAQRGMPVPEGWTQGAPAVLAAAERADPGGNLWTDTSNQLLAIGVSLLLVSLAGLIAAARRRRARPSLRPNTELLKKLAAARSGEVPTRVGESRATRPPTDRLAEASMDVVARVAGLPM